MKKFRSNLSFETPLTAKAHTKNYFGAFFIEKSLMHNIVACKIESVGANIWSECGFKRNPSPDTEGLSLPLPAASKGSNIPDCIGLMVISFPF